MILSDLFNIAAPYLTGATPPCSLIEAVRLVHTGIVNHLLQVKGDALVEEVQVSVGAGDDTGYLPDEFLSLCRRPQIVGGSFLSVITSSDTSAMETAGTPTKYEIIGKLIVVYPPTDTDITLKMLARLSPVLPVALSDELPFGGAFDQIYVDGVVAILGGDPAFISGKQYLAAVQLQLDQILSGTSADDEQLLADSINGL